MKLQKCCTLAGLGILSLSQAAWAINSISSSQHAAAPVSAPSVGGLSVVSPGCGASAQQAYATALDACEGQRYQGYTYNSTQLQQVIQNGFVYTPGLSLAAPGFSTSSPIGTHCAGKSATTSCYQSYANDQWVFCDSYGPVVSAQTAANAAIAACNKPAAVVKAGPPNTCATDSKLKTLESNYANDWDGCNGYPQQGYTFNPAGLPGVTSTYSGVISAAYTMGGPCSQGVCTPYGASQANYCAGRSQIKDDITAIGTEVKICSGVESQAQVNAAAAAQAAATAAAQAANAPKPWKCNNSAFPWQLPAGYTNGGYNITTYPGYAAVLKNGDGKTVCMGEGIPANNGNGPGGQGEYGDSGNCVGAFPQQFNAVNAPGLTSLPGFKSGIPQEFTSGGSRFIGWIDGSTTSYCLGLASPTQK